MSPTTALPPELTIGQLSARSGVATSALRYYEAEGLIHSHRNDVGHRRYARETLRRVAFVRAAQTVGLTLDEIGETLRALPDGRTPDSGDWSALAASWRPRLDAQLAYLQRLRERLLGCIGCGCLSMHACPIVNEDDRCAAEGPGARLLGPNPCAR